MVNMGPGTYEANASNPPVGYSFGNPRNGDSLIAGGTSKSKRPKSTMNKRPRASAKTNKGRGGPNFDELDTYNDPPKFGSSAKGGPVFGAPKPSSSLMSKTRQPSRRSTAN